MKRLTKPTLVILLAIILFGCSKNNSESLPATDQTPELHAYGVLPMQPEQWSFVPEFSTAIVAENARTSGLLVKTSLFGPSLALSPLFVYYVERCVIMKQPITADGGAYMVAIPQTLQGLSNNRGTGTPLTFTINNIKYTFGGA